jgi:hypothetical protein
LVAYLEGCGTGTEERGGKRYPLKSYPQDTCL